MIVLTKGYDMSYSGYSRLQDNLKKNHDASVKYYRKKQGVSTKDNIKDTLRKTESNMAVAINLKRHRDNMRLSFDVLRLLHYDFNNCFKDRYKQPLKIGILSDVIEHYNKHYERYKPSVFKKAIAIYTKSIPYLASHKEGENRIDLNGNIVGQVTEKEALYAEQCLKIKLDSLRNNNHRRKCFNKRIKRK